MVNLYVILIICLTFAAGCSSQSSDEQDVSSSFVPASLEISLTTYDYNYSAAGTQISQTFTLTNNGGFNASTFSQSGTSGPFRFKGLSFPGSGGSCTPFIPSGTNCTIVLEFAPTSLNIFDENFDLQYIDGENTQIVSTNLLGRSVNAADPPTLLTLNNPLASPSNDPTPEITISGGDISTGQTVKLYTDSTCTTEVASGVSAGTSINLTSSILTDGIYNFYATTTNSFGYASNCSTATLNYVLDLTDPNPQTLITHSLTHDNINTSPFISWTLSTSPDVSTQYIALSTNSSGGNEIAGFNSIASAINNHVFSGQSLTECTDYYATLYAEDTVGNTSIYAVSPHPFR